MFLRNEFDCGKTRRGLFNGKNPKFPFAHKIVVTKRPRWIEGSKGSPRHSYAWFVWDFAHEGGAYVAMFTRTTARRSGKCKAVRT
jgi:hypothetical protein